MTTASLARGGAPAHGLGLLMATIREVARRAGVSTATVSRVLSQPGVVAPATREAVLEAVTLLRYIPNSTARNLRTLRSGKLLVTVPDISNPFFSEILQGIESTAHASGYAVLLGDTQHDEKREDRYAQMLQRKEADGLIFLGHRLPKAAAALVQAHAPRPAPIVNGCEFSPRLGVPSVHIDNASAAFEAIDHLIALGHRRIGVITGPLVSPLSRDRLEGALARAKRAGLARHIRIFKGDFQIDSGVAGAKELLQHGRRPTAIFCFNDEMAIGVIDVARRLGLGVPGDLSVIGFDDIRFARFLDPPLTTIVQPTRELGEEAVRLLLTILSGEMATIRSVTLPHTLVVRASTAKPAKAASPKRAKR